MVQHKANVRQAFGGEGVSLGGGSSGGGAEAVSPEDARAKRLARFGKTISTGEGAKPDPEVARCVRATARLYFFVCVSLVVCSCLYVRV